MRKPLRECLAYDFFYHEPGENNAITDVPGVLVGHSTLNKGESIRTGVTVVMPGDLDKGKFIAGGHVFNANGEVTGLHYIFEEARLISPIFLTNTLSVGDVFSAVVDYFKPKLALPVIGECWDGYLNDIWGRHIQSSHVVEAIETARAGKVIQGSVGAGTGMMSFGFKAGIGTASRKFAVGNKEYTLGVLVNNNMGNEDGRHRYLRISGLNVDRLLHEPKSPLVQKRMETHQSSSIVVVATDAPLAHYQLNRLARHAALGYGRIGLVSYAGSGDFILSFSTHNRLPKNGSGQIARIEVMEDSLLDTFFEVVEETTEEALLNSLFCAENMVGVDNHQVKALPVDAIVQALKVKESQP